MNRTEHRDFGNGYQVKLATIDHFDETEYIVIVEKDYRTCREYEFNEDKQRALACFAIEINEMNKRMKNMKIHNKKGK